MSNLTLKIENPFMKGSVVREWQKDVNDKFEWLDINFRLKLDGVYGIASRDGTARLLYALGIPLKKMEHGVSPELRSKVRNLDLTDYERRTFESKARTQWRRRLRARFDTPKVAKPVNRIEGSSWGYHGRQHDGIDVLCPANAVLYAMVKCRVIDVRSGGWWGKAPSGDVRKGDGIIQVEILENVGPFKKGYHIGYGHAEKAMVRKGQVLEAGEPLGHAGLAVAWHIHLMLNDGSTNEGRGNRDPRAILNYSIKHG